MINLGSWMNGILIGWGVDPKIAYWRSGWITYAKRSLSAA